MATRTPKAATKTKAGAKGGQGPKAAKPAGVAKRAAGKPKAAKGGKATTATGRQPEPVAAAAPEPRPSVSERFWHRIGLGAQAKEERAHQRHLEHEAELARQVEEDRRERERLAAEQEQQRRAHAAEQRKADAKAAREMARIAREEDERMHREAEEARARAAQERREAAKQAKLAAAAEAQRIEDEKAAKRAAAAEARREKARQAKLAEEAKAEERRRARDAKAEAKAEAKAREAEEKAREEELARLAEEAEARRASAKAEVAVTIREREPEASSDGAAGEAGQGDEVEAGDEVEMDEEPEAHGRVPSAGAAKVPSEPSAAASDLESQADRVAAELRARRSKPVTIDADDAPAPMLPVGRRSERAAAGDEKQVLQLDPAPPARMPESSAPRGLSIPEHFLLLALDEGWDERREKARPGGLGGALTGALLLELVLRGKVRVQRDRFQVTDADVDGAADAVAAKMAEWGDLPSLQAMGELAKWLPQLLPAYKDRMMGRGLIEHRAWRHLGMFYRSQTALLDPDAQDHLRNKLARAIAGGGRPDAPTILSLGLLEACGLFGLVVPEGAQAYNRKRLNGLLAGKDVMGYKVDDELKGVQEAAVRTILDNVRIMTVRG